MLPFTTTTSRNARWSTSVPGQLDQVRAVDPCVVGKVSGKELWAYRGASETGFHEDLTAKLNTDLADVRYNDLVTDLGTGTTYRVVWARMRQGLGMDHMEAGLAAYAPTDTYSLYRGSTIDADGDEVPAMPGSAQPVWANIPAEVREVGRDVQASVTGQPSTVRQIAGRFPPGMDIRPQDRIVADSSGQLFVVTSVGLISEATGADVGVELTRITV